MDKPDLISEWDLRILDSHGLLMTRAANPPDPTAKYCVWDCLGKRGYGKTLTEAIDEWKVYVSAY